ncbi:actin binding protein [Cavenderia fasciculata]|uniref:Actin binding protein n=1 Tax=Cavenderia fasciculata TaxID=261658 RepID=F4PPH4_CACFS|nr:actin binding protein [Cavenderia fasciculata]EGG22287.1 actin binding protein [Cavenderia fasciculata]|eukprot:XP_004360138.1 actin binding protein [Cavenderia fasciculata]
MSTDTISLKVRLVDKKVFKKFQFYPKKSVKDARLHIAKEMDVDADQYGLFLPPRDDQNGIWFRDDYPLDFYGLEGEVDQKEALLFSSKEAPMMEFVEFKKRYRPIKVAKGDNQYKTVMVDDTMNVAEAIAHIITHVPTTAAITENELYNMGDDEVEVLSGDMTIREQGYVGECTTGLLKNEKGEINLYVKVPYFEGWIMRKRGGGLMKGLKNWNKRWYTLKKNKLVYHKAKGFGPEMGCIFMKTVQAVRAATTGTDIPSKYVKSCFEVATPGRTYIFLANNPSEMKKWVEILDFSRRMFAYETAFFGVANRTVSSGSGKGGEYSRSNLTMGNRRRGANGEEGGMADFDDDTTSDEDDSDDDRPKRRGGEAADKQQREAEAKRVHEEEERKKKEEERKEAERREEERVAEVKRVEEEERKQREREEEERQAEVKRVEEEQERKRVEEEQELVRKQEEFLAKQQQLELEKQKQMQDQIEEDKRLEELMLQMELEQEERIKLREEQERVEKEREEIAKRLQEEQEKLRLEREVLEKERIETEERIERERVERVQREEEEKKRREEVEEQEKKRQEDARIAQEERKRVQEEERKKREEQEEQERQIREEEEEKRRQQEEEEEENNSQDDQQEQGDDDFMEELDKEREEQEQKHIASRRLQTTQARLEAIEVETPELKFLLKQSSKSTPEDLLLAWTNYIIEETNTPNNQQTGSSSSSSSTISAQSAILSSSSTTTSTTASSYNSNNKTTTTTTTNAILSPKQFSVSIDSNLELYSKLLSKLEPQEFSITEFSNQTGQVEKAEYIVQTLQSLGVETITAEQLLSTDENVHMNVLLTIYEEIGSNWQEEFQSQLVSKRVFASKYIYHILAQSMPSLSVPSSPYELLESLRDGNILCHLINKIFKGMVDERVIQRNIEQGNKIDNLNIAINASRALGSKYESGTVVDLETITPLQMHHLSWEVVELCLLQSANPSRNNNLFTLMRAETRNAFRALEHEKIMLRWFNYHLRKNSNRQINNFTDDMEDCENYAYLFDQIAPQVSRKKEILAEKDWEKRAEIVLDMAAKIGCLGLLTPTDIVETENSKLNLLFVADIMRVCPAMPTYKMGADEELDDFVAKSSEQSNNHDQQLLQWINGMELGIPEVVNMLDDLKDGTLNVAGIAGTDILNGDLRVNRAILLQIRRFLGDKVVVDVATAHQAQALKWANSKINPESKVKLIQSFKDQFLQDSIFFLALLDALVPGKQDRSYITPGQSDGDMEKNAKYFLTLAWSSAIPLVVVWEDVAKVRSKSIKHIIETLQDWDTKKQLQHQQS